MGLSKVALFALVQIFLNILIINAEKVSTPLRKYSYQIKNFTVPVDHFNFANNKTFELRYLYNGTFAAQGDNSPILFYTGNEGDIELFAENTGFMWDIAPQIGAKLVFAEHRYYGHSLPFGDATFNRTENIGYLSVEQTLEDFALLIDFLAPQGSVPVIAFGGSYGGMLSAWLRIKYPHLVAGALAASAPVWQFNGLTPCDIYFRIITSIFNTALTPNCSENIRNSWDLFKGLAATDDGRKQLNGIFKFCQPIQQPNDLTKFFEYLEDIYGNLAMANYPYKNDFLAPLPAYPVRQFCYYLKDIHNVTHLLGAMQQAISVYSNFTGTTKCLDMQAYDPTLGGTAWDIQTCNQMVMPMCSNITTSMFRNNEWNFKSYSDKCFSRFNIRPKLNDIVLRYGGKNLEGVSNIIFSNGLLDPWSGGGVLQAYNNDITIIIIPEGAHHLDLRSANDADPVSVVEARKQELNIIQNWIAEYQQNYRDL